MIQIDEPYLVNMLTRSLSIPTPATGLLEHDPALRDFNETFLATELQHLGASTSIDDMGNSIANLAGTGRPILIVTYAMTHQAGDMPDPFTPRTGRDQRSGRVNKVWGRGACEQRGAMCAVLAALAATRDKPTRRPVTLISLASGETGRHHAAAKALSAIQLSPEFGIVAVCTDNAIVHGHKGRADVHVSAQGKAAHSSTPQLGNNAAEAIVRFLASALPTGPLSSHPQLGARTIALTALGSGPAGSHTVPSHARATLDVRLLPGERPEDVYALLPDPSDFRDATVSIEVGNTMRPAELTSDSPPLAALRRAYDAELHRPARAKWMSGSTDMGYLNHVGIPTACFGPGDEALAHTSDDHLDIDQAIEAARIYAWLVAEPDPLLT
jgi:acetylornithine deacetylase/succinyl-diaminopimelate desuccinylase-like protein